MKCQWCGKEFIPVRITQKYCSDFCRNRQKYENVRLRNEIRKKELNKFKHIEEKNEDDESIVKCNDENCRYFSSKIRNHCSILVDVDFKGKKCTFSKSKITTQL